MTLDPSVLRNSIKGFFDPPGMPSGGASDAVLQWAKAYCLYAQSATAGLTRPAELIPVASPQVGTFIDVLDSCLRQMWMSVLWSGPALTGTTASIPSLASVMDPVFPVLNRTRDAGQALSLITESLHTYTLGITVFIVSASGAITLFPVV